MIDRKASVLRKPVVVWLLALLSCALWGSAYPCIKIGYRLFAVASGDTAGQILLAGCRFTLAGILTILIGSALERRWLLPQRGASKKILVLAMFQTVGQYLLFYVGMANTTGVKGSIIGGTTAFIVLAVAGLLRLEKLSGRKIMGCALGFVGVVLVNIRGGEGAVWDINFLGEGFLLLSTVSAAVSNVCLKCFSESENPVMMSGWQFFFGGLTLAGCGLLAGGRLAVWTAGGAALLVYMALLSAVAYSLWGILLQYNPFARVVVFQFTIPVFGVALSAVLLGETGNINLMTLAALALVCAGIYMVNRGKTQETGPAA